MSKVKTVLKELKASVSGSSSRKSSHHDLFPRKDRHSTESPVRGGEEKEVEAKLSSTEDLVDDSGTDSDSDHHGPPQKHIEDFLTNNTDPPEIKEHYGKLPIMQSIPPPRKEHERPERWWHLAQMTSESAGQHVVFRGRIHVVRHMSAKMCFIVFREGIDTIQGVLRAKDGEVSENMVRFAEHMRPGTIVLTKGLLRQAEQRVNLTSVHDVEIEITDLHLESARTVPVPFSVYEAEEQTEDHRIADRVRLANRILDLRTPTSQAIFRIQSGVCHFFRDYLDHLRFVEIHTPKLQGGATEGGSEVFKLNYFGRDAFLAQSPQLAKQMCIAADFQRVYEIGPVFRAENSNTPRHLTEYTGLDIEMVIDTHYHEAMHTIDNTLKHIFKGIYKRYRPEIETLKHHFPSEDMIIPDETVRITFAEGAKLLNESGWKNDDGEGQSEYEDLPTKAERELGRLVKEKYNTDYYILDKFPASARPFYTMPDAENPNLTNSFDFMVRGQEILSGGQRVHDYDMLKNNLERMGMDPETLKEYMDGFAYIAPPHAGAGIGLERVVSLILELGNLRYASLFHRDPKSFPQPPRSDLRYPDDSTLSRHKGKLQPLENLVANYGDATNTSFMDERFRIWRDDKTGAAIAYTPEHGRAVCAGDPLCDPRQYGEVAEAFIEWLQEAKGMKPIWVLIGKPFEAVIGERFGFRSFSVAAEQRVDLERHAHLQVDKDVERKVRHAKNEGVEVTEYGNKIPDEMKTKIDQRIKDWQAGRKGEQVHLSDITPWVDQTHRQYFVAQDKEGKVHSMVVLAELALKHGVQVKWALDFPGAPNGSIEMIVQDALKSAAASNKQATFGAGASPELKAGHHISSTKAASLAKMYDSITKRMHLENKTGFRAKFNPWHDPVYIAYPAKGLGQKGIRAIVDFFKEDGHSETSK
ncbi:aspartate--tRNA ligase dps1 [Exophiala xenobiotica]|uniref:aspartate--tRNA ligase n=1 Tax=Lithohypha guttulata TaxID=1690604 RepID=A0ABR0KFI2_9EURO|nr:aspartate--tRNA ligase dps1 [Lithohypha guttulata]KAK5320874.1 aspartate--tRNA ligase dps1 [Exophiala xenobiotica]